MNHWSNTLRSTRGKKITKARRKIRPLERSISGALIGGGKAGKRYITVWHDGASWSAIYWERTRLKPMINEPVWPRRKRSESGMTFPRFLLASDGRVFRGGIGKLRSRLSRPDGAVINRIEMYKIWSLHSAAWSILTKWSRCINSINRGGSDWAPTLFTLYNFRVERWSSRLLFRLDVFEYIPRNLDHGKIAGIE